MSRPADPWHRALSEGEVHVWRVPLDSAPHDPACLSEEERARAARVVSAVERDRFVAARIAVRHILGAYHGVTAHELVLAREPLGRPVVQGSSGVHFSLTHSRGLALVALAAAPVGVDLEHVREVRHLARIAPRLLHEDTVRTIESAPPDTRALLFLDAWTQREAHVKAVGGGLFQTPDTLPLTAWLAPHGSMAAVVDRHDGSRWTVVRLLPTPTARAAVAVRDAVARVRLRTWRGHGSTEAGGTTG